MLKLKDNVKGLIPLLICIIAVVLVIMFFAFERVSKIKH